MRAGAALGRKRSAISAYDGRDPAGLADADPHAEQEQLPEDVAAAAQRGEQRSTRPAPTAMTRLRLVAVGQ